MASRKRVNRKRVSRKRTSRKRVSRRRGSRKVVVRRSRGGSGFFDMFRKKPVFVSGQYTAEQLKRLDEGCAQSDLASGGYTVFDPISGQCVHPK